jgi:hypothetical protein
LKAIESLPRLEDIGQRLPILARPILGCVLACVVGMGLLQMTWEHEARLQDGLRQAQQNQRQWQRCLEQLPAVSSALALQQQQRLALEQQHLFADSSAHIWQQRLLSKEIRALANVRDVRVQPSTTSQDKTQLPRHRLHIEATLPHEDAALRLLDQMQAELPGYPHIQSCLWIREPPGQKGLNLLLSLNCELIWPQISTPPSKTLELPSTCPPHQ